MVLGYRGHPDWRDLSEYVVHFVRGDPEKEDTGYGPMMSILGSGHIEARNAFGAAKNLDGQLEATQRSACFSEAPLDLLDRLTQRRQTKYGIAFTQQFVAQNNGGRVWYLDAGSAPQRAMRERVRQSMIGGIDPTDPLWELTPFVDYPTDEPVQNRFEWEREWRVPGGLRFQEEDVAFLFIPDELHEVAREFFTRAQAEHLGPAYFCPYLDPDWNDEMIQKAVIDLPPPPVTAG